MTDKPTEFMITPDTKVGALLDQFPQLEEVLIKLSPAFGHLRNPILRKTVAKVATLQQVARIGNLSLGMLINTLREAAGVAGGEWKEEASKEHDLDMPDWLKGATIVKSFDARALIEAGGHPMGQVLDHVKELKPGEVYEFATPFLPAPLLDIVKNKGYVVWSHSPEPGVHRNYIAFLK